MKFSFRSFWAYALPIVLLLGGLVFLFLASGLRKLGIPEWVSMLCFMFTYNLILAWCLGLLGKLRNVWDIRKIHHSLYGFVLGAFPISVSAYFLGVTVPVAEGSLRIYLSSLGVTFMVVLWEELWFRGLILNFAAKKYSPLGAAVLFGFLFALLHALNPAISLWRDGFGLFLAGYTLSVCYFFFESLWAAVGMHLANNSIESFLGLHT